MSIFEKYQWGAWQLVTISTFPRLNFHENIYMCYCHRQSYRPTHNRMTTLDSSEMNISLT